MQPLSLAVPISVTLVTRRLQNRVSPNVAGGTRERGIVVGGVLGATLANNIVDRSRNARVRCYTSQTLLQLCVSDEGCLYLCGLKLS
jgi:hypothetical protein